MEPEQSDKCLLYAPENFSNPNKIWPWKAGKRISYNDNYQNYSSACVLLSLLFFCSLFSPIFHHGVPLFVAFIITLMQLMFLLLHYDNHIVILDIHAFFHYASLSALSLLVFFFV